MSYFTIEDFKGGLDVRRSRFTSVAGTLQQLVNAHITRGGDIEKRKAFVDITPAFNGTALRDMNHVIAMAADSAGLIAIGNSGPSSTNLPAGMRYMQLKHPYSSSALITSVPAWTNFGGKLYCAVNYDDGSQWHWYDGSLVYDWNGGVVRTTMLNRTGIATHLQQMIAAGGIYTADNGGMSAIDTITITGPVGVDYNVAVTTFNGGATNDQNLLINTITSGIPAVDEVRATAAFPITAAIEGAGNQVTQVAVYAGATLIVNLLAAAVPARINAKVTAVDVANAIAARRTTTGYTAVATNGVVYVYAPHDQGNAPNGRVLKITSAGQCVLNSCSFAITGGTNVAGTNQLAMVTMTGKQLMSGAVDWATSNEATATAVAANIQAFASVPKVSACALGDTVYLSLQVVRSDDPIRTVTIKTAGDVTVDVGYAAPGGAPGVPDTWGNPTPGTGGAGGNGGGTRVP